MCTAWERKRRTVREKAATIIPSQFGIFGKVDIGDGKKRPATTADVKSRTDDLIGRNLGLFCKEVEVSVRVIDFGLQLTTFQAGIREGFDEDTIYALLDVLVFQTILKKSKLGATLLERFNGMYTIPAVAYICTIVGVLRFFFVAGCLII